MNIPCFIEVQTGQQASRALGRPFVDQRTLDSQRLDRNAFALVVRDGLVGRKVVDVDAGRAIEFSHRRRQKIARAHERRHLHGSRRVVQEVEDPDQVIEGCHCSLFDALVER